MAGQIEVRAFMQLFFLFKERGWGMPQMFPLESAISGRELLAWLNIPEDQVEVFFINGKVALPTRAVIRPGDRVGIVPPGVPGPYRVLMGFKNKG